jgi:hypothetical protein
MVRKTASGTWRNLGSGILRKTWKRIFAQKSGLLRSVGCLKIGSNSAFASNVQREWKHEKNSHAKNGLVLESSAGDGDDST